MIVCGIGGREGKEEGAVRVEMLYSQGHGSVVWWRCIGSCGIIMVDGGSGM